MDDNKIVEYCKSLNVAKLCKVINKTTVNKLFIDNGKRNPPLYYCLETFFLQRQNRKKDKLDKKIIQIFKLFLRFFLDFNISIELSEELKKYFKTKYTHFKLYELIINKYFSREYRYNINLDTINDLKVTIEINCKFININNNYKWKISNKKERPCIKILS